MYILLGFPESAQKQNFHLDEAKRSRETNDTGKEQADVMFQKENQQFW